MESLKHDGRNKPLPSCQRWGRGGWSQSAALRKQHGSTGRFYRQIDVRSTNPVSQTVSDFFRWSTYRRFTCQTQVHSALQQTSAKNIKSLSSREPVVCSRSDGWNCMSVSPHWTPHPSRWLMPAFQSFPTLTDRLGAIQPGRQETRITARRCESSGRRALPQQHF